MVFHEGVEPQHAGRKPAVPIEVADRLSELSRAARMGMNEVDNHALHAGNIQK
jgi:hypothetical protein